MTGDPRLTARALRDKYMLPEGATKSEARKRAIAEKLNYVPPKKSIELRGADRILRLARKYNYLINRGFIATGTPSREMHKAFRMFAHRRVL